MISSYFKKFCSYLQFMLWFLTINNSFMFIIGTLIVVHLSLWLGSQNTWCCRINSVNNGIYKIFTLIGVLIFMFTNFITFYKWKVCYNMISLWYNFQNLQYVEQKQLLITEFMQRTYSTLWNIWLYHLNPKFEQEKLQDWVYTLYFRNWKVEL